MKTNISRSGPAHLGIFFTAPRNRRHRRKPPSTRQWCAPPLGLWLSRPPLWRAPRERVAAPRAARAREPRSAPRALAHDVAAAAPNRLAACARSAIPTRAPPPSQNTIVFGSATFAGAGAVALLGSCFSKTLSKDRGLTNLLIITATVCCWLMWLITYMMQLRARRPLRSPHVPSPLPPRLTCPRRRPEWPLSGCIAPPRTADPLVKPIPMKEE